MSIATMNGTTIIIWNTDRALFIPSQIKDEYVTDMGISNIKAIISSQCNITPTFGDLCGVDEIIIDGLKVRTRIYVMLSFVGDIEIKKGSQIKICEYEWPHLEEQ